MKIALAQINSFTADILFNEKTILKYIIKAQRKGVQLLIFPEIALNGYSPLDLLHRKFFLQKTTQSIKKIHKETPKNMVVLLGAVGPGFPPTISVFKLQKDKPAQIFSKEVLANYDVFDEERYFQKGNIQDNYFTYKNHFLQVLICEETWRKPCLKHKKKPNLIISLNASPFSELKDQKRQQVSGKWAKKYQCPFIYVNSVGGQEELIFDGGSFVLDKTGKLLHQSPFFQENLSYFSLEKKTKALKENTSKPEHTVKALTFGISEFVRKNGFQKVHLGLSGGVDSALVAALACKALGEKKVTLFFLPGPFTSSFSQKCAYQMAHHIKCPLISQDIEKFYFDFLESKHLTSKKQFSDITKQNIQARLRNLFLMAHANNHPESLLLGTSNKSELALGYGTLYGDLTGGLLPIGDVFKTEVYPLARYLKIPDSILRRSPSAELKKNQKDEDDLPPYKILDPILKKLIEKEEDPNSPFEKKIFKEIINSEFKRRQSPPILKIKNRSFDRGWRLPLSIRI